jgi:hypothetical protein
MKIRAFYLAVYGIRNLSFRFRIVSTLDQLPLPITRFCNRPKRLPNLGDPLSWIMSMSLREIIVLIL